MKSKRFFSLFGETKKLAHDSIASALEAVGTDSEASAHNTVELSPLFMSLTNGDKQKHALYRNYLEAFKDAQLLLEQGDYAQARAKALQAKGCLLDIDIIVVLMADLIRIDELEDLIDKSSMKSKC